MLGLQSVTIRYLSRRNAQTVVIPEYQRPNVAQRSAAGTTQLSASNGAFTEL